MSLELLAFWVLAMGGLFTASAALLAREVVHTIMWIAAFFIAMALIFFLLLAPFLGVLELAVYAGAVTILFLFAVMVVRKSIFSREAATGFSAPSIALTLLLAFLMTEAAFQYGSLSPRDSYPVTALSQGLFTMNGEWVLVLGLIMLSALVGGVYLARESRSRPIRREGQ